MTTLSLGDLASSLVLRNRTTQLRQTMAQLTQEMSTGQIADPNKRLGGDLSYLTEIERNLKTLEGFKLATGEAAIFADAVQASLGRIHDSVTDLAPTLIVAGQALQPAVRDNAIYQAQSALEAAVSALNAEVSGRSLFGGTAIDRAPLADAGTLLAELGTVLAGLTSPADIRQAASDWFDDPAGFRAVIYDGAAQGLAPFRLGAGEEVGFDLRADDPAIRDVLRDLALVALADDPSLAWSATTQNGVMIEAGEALLNNANALAGLRSDLGYAQGRIEAAETRNAAARNSLEIARNNVLQADPFETATRLEETQFQLESLYSVTVRTSRLSLLSFLQG